MGLEKYGLLSNYKYVSILELKYENTELSRAPKRWAYPQDHVLLTHVFKCQRTAARA